MTWDSNKTILAVIVLLLIILSWWLPNALIDPVISLKQEERHEPDYFVENFTTTAMSEQGTPRYSLSARSLTHFPDDDSTLLDKPKLTQFTPGGAPTHTSADKGRLYSDGKELLMMGNVRVTRGKNQDTASAEVSTNELHIVLN